MMRFVKGLCSYMSTALLIIGICIPIASKFNHDLESLDFLGILMIVISVLINLLFSIRQPREFKVISLIYFWVNGFIIFTYCTIIGFPIGKMIKNTLPDSFVAWKAGNLYEYKRIVMQQNKDEIARYLSLSDLE